MLSQYILIAQILLEIKVNIGSILNVWATIIRTYVNALDILSIIR